MDLQILKDVSKSFRTLNNYRFRLQGEEHWLDYCEKFTHVCEQSMFITQIKGTYEKKRDSNYAPVIILALKSKNSLYGLHFSTRSLGLQSKSKVHQGVQLHHIILDGDLSSTTDWNVVWDIVKSCQSQDLLIGFLYISSMSNVLFFH